MKTKLEDFIHNNRSAFDTHEPSEALWHRLEKKLDAGINNRPKQQAKIFSIKIKLAVAAAAVFIIAAGVMFFLAKNPADPTDNFTTNNLPQDNNDEIMVTASHVPNDTGKTLPAENGSIQKGKIEKAPVITNENSALSKQMYHYSQLIELQQKEIAVIKDQNPQLYQRFLKDLEALEYSYETLREKQKNGINSEQLLEAMILNLKMQSSLLNKQLEVTKHIKNRNDEEEVNGL